MGVSLKIKNKYKSDITKEENIIKIFNKKLIKIIIFLEKRNDLIET